MFEPLESPLTAEQAAHLLGRAALRSHPLDVREATGRTATAMVQYLLETPSPSLLEQVPPWLVKLYPSNADDVEAFLNDNQYYVQEVRDQWGQELLRGGIRARMELFWHNHFVTDVRKYYYGALAWHYMSVLREYGMGSFPELLRAITVDGAMLYYLDGRFNYATSPNENYARELLELFTMGPVALDGTPNYTQEDIAETARALAGYRMDVRVQWKALRNRTWLDRGQKTIFGKTANFDVNGLVNHIMDARGRQVAQFLSAALLREFVHAEPDDLAIELFADEIVGANFVIRDVLQILFSSSYFFEERFRGARIKSPTEYLVLLADLAISQPTESDGSLLRRGSGTLGQELLSPPNVAGWPGHREWLNADSMPRRWSIAETLNTSLAMGDRMHSLLRSLIPPGAAHEAVDVALGLAQTLFAIPLDSVDIPAVDAPFAGDLIAAPLPDALLQGPAYAQHLVKHFLGDIPWYEWYVESPRTPAMVRAYLNMLTALPAYQLT